MDDVWLRRLRWIAGGLLAGALASLAVSGLLFAAGDRTGAEALLGAATMAGLGFVVDVCVLAFRDAC